MPENANKASFYLRFKSVRPGFLLFLLQRYSSCFSSQSIHRHKAVKNGYSFVLDEPHSL